MGVKDRVFLFEFATCTSQPFPPSAGIEGYGMFQTLYKGFDEPISFFKQRSYLDLFEEYLEKSEFVVAIAPETGLELYNLTRLIEKSGCKNLGSNSTAVKLASDKLLTYRRLKELSPETEVFKGKTNLELPLIAKPRDGISCEGVMMIGEEGELEKIPHGYLVQEYVPGRPMSASVLVGDEAHILTVNTQEINGFEYYGAKLPIKLSNSFEIIEAVQRFPGLFGYVGIDFVLNEGKPMIIEVNPRPTTPIIGINYAFETNISKLIIDNFYRKNIPDFKPIRTVHIQKNKKSSGFVSRNGYSLEVMEIDYDINT
jgi:predicted ATP-grasp superfamily ATP-dependent carboligase